MASEAYRQWYVQGLQAVRTAVIRARDASASGDMSPDAKEMMEAGSKVFSQHAETLDDLLQRAGANPSSMRNPFMNGIQEGSRLMIQAAGDAAVREASFVAAAQIATHYFIAAYGTLASAARHLGLTDEAKALSDMTDEMKAGDQRFTGIAETMANAQAGAA